MADTKQDLYDRARDLDIEGRSGMSKEQLEEAIKSRESSSHERFRKPNGNWLHDHLLSISLLILFVLSIVG
ncbi:MAG TPA: Rho termination factor N-terminal domain-containing protein, partial [Acidimicrobiia bacterium]